MEKDTRYELLDKASISADQISRPSVSYWKDAWRRFRKDKLAMFGLVMILIVSLFAIFGVEEHIPCHKGAYTGKSGITRDRTGKPWFYRNLKR